MISVLPLADAGDMIGIIVFIVIMVISAISQMAGNKKEAPRPKPRPRPPVRPAQGGPAQGGPAQGGPGRPAQAGPGRQNPVAGELEEFLRRAAGGGQQPARRPPPVPAAKPAARPAARPVARPVLTEPVVAEAADELEIVESVADHVSHSVGDSRFPSSVADDSVSRKFDHQMGQLDSSPKRETHAAAIAEPESHAAEVVESMPSTAAAGLAAMLASPASLRQAILLKEILERPEHRWS